MLLKEYVQYIRDGGVKSEDEVEACMRWAFGGDGWRQLDLSQGLSRWNSMHPECFVMKITEDAEVSFKEVAKAYLQFVEKLAQLEFYSTEELIMAVEKRFQNFILMGRRIVGRNEVTAHRISGRMIECIAMCRLLQDRCVEIWNATPAEGGTPEK